MHIAEDNLKDIFIGQEDSDLAVMWRTEEGYGCILVFEVAIGIDAGIEIIAGIDDDPCTPLILISCDGGAGLVSAEEVEAIFKEMCCFISESCLRLGFSSGEWEPSFEEKENCWYYELKMPFSDDDIIDIKEHCSRLINLGESIYGYVRGFKDGSV